MSEVAMERARFIRRGKLLVCVVLREIGACAPWRQERGGIAAALSLLILIARESC